MSTRSSRPMPRTSPPGGRTRWAPRRSTACAHPERNAGIADDVRTVAGLRGPRGRGHRGSGAANGLERAGRVPLGVVAVVYEARPNVTIDCSPLPQVRQRRRPARLREAIRSNAVLARIAPEAEARATRGLGSLIAGGGRDELAELPTQRGYIDLVIPAWRRGAQDALSAAPACR